MKILLTGANGFIGSAFWKLAIRKGHEVAGLIRPPHLVGVSNIPGEMPQWIAGTLEDPPWEQIRKFKPDACVHAAWITTPGIYLESPENERFRDSSRAFLRRVSELGTNYLVGIGTCIEYEMTGRCLSEDATPIRPTTLYARCKNELRLALEAEARGKVDLCWGRVFYPYGPGEHPARLCSSLFAKLRRGEQVVLKTPGSVKDYIYIDDLAEAILRTIEKRFTGVINWGTGIGLKVSEIATEIAKQSGVAAPAMNVGSSAVDALDYVVADSRRLRGLGWVPQTTLSEGIRQLRRAQLIG